MTKEEKQLLLQDLCARLPYGVKVKCIIDFSYDLELLDSSNIIEFIPKEFAIDTHGIVEYIEDNDEFDKGTQHAIQEALDMKVITIDNLIPYLRPMSSMTKEEKEEYRELCSNCLEQDIVDYNISTLDDSQLIFVIEFLYSHHIDFRGLIEKGLALEAPIDMYK